MDTGLEKIMTVEIINQRPDPEPRPRTFNVFWIYATTEMGPWLHEIECPCLVLTGDLDGGCNPRLNHFMHAELLDFELVILDGLKHSILIEAPERVLSPLKQFLLNQIKE